MPNELINEHPKTVEESLGYIKGVLQSILIQVDKLELQLSTIGQFKESQAVVNSVITNEIKALEEKVETLKKQLATLEDEFWDQIEKRDKLFAAQAKEIKENEDIITAYQKFGNFFKKNATTLFIGFCAVIMSVWGKEAGMYLLGIIKKFLTLALVGGP